MKRILLVDDEKGICELFTRFHDVLEPTFQGQCGMDVATSLEQAEARLSDTDYSVIILDLTLPPMNAENVISWVFEKAHEMPPIVILTGDEDDWTRRRCMVGGAAQFFTKTDAVNCPNTFFKVLYNEYLKRYAERHNPSV